MSGESEAKYDSSFRDPHSPPTSVHAAPSPSESRERAPLSQRMKTVYLVCSTVSSVAGFVLMNVIKRRFLRR